MLDHASLFLKHTQYVTLRLSHVGSDYYALGNIKSFPLLVSDCKTKGERVAKIMEWPNFVPAECHWQVLNLPKWLRCRQNSPKARESVIFCSRLTIFISRLIRISSKFAAKIRNFLQLPRTSPHLIIYIKVKAIISWHPRLRPAP